MKRKLVLSLVLVLLLSTVMSFSDSKVGESMATLNLYNQTAYDCAFRVSGLQYNWNESNYQGLTLTDGSTVNGSYDSPDGNWYYSIYAPPTGTDRFVDDILSGLAPETTYTLRAYAYGADGRWWYAGIDTIKTAPEVTPDTPFFDYIELIGGNSARLNFAKAPLTQYTEVFWNTSGSTPDYWAGYLNRTTSSTNITINDLPYASDVYFWIRSRDNAGVTSTWTWGDMVTTADRPANFTGFSSLNNSGSAVNVPAVEWNALCDKLNEFRAYKGLGSSSFTYVTANVTFISADIYNEVRNSLNSLSAYFTGGYTIPAAKVSMVDSIYPTDFTRLKNALNSIP